MAQRRRLHADGSLRNYVGLLRLLPAARSGACRLALAQADMPGNVVIDDHGAGAADLRVAERLK